LNRDEKAAVVEQVATQIQESEAIFAVDYRGISVQQVAELRQKLGEADATLRVVKNTLTELAADKAGAESLKELLEGPTAFTFVKGDAALAAKAIATFRREHEVLAFKGGTMDGNAMSIDELEALSKLPARDVLHGQLVGMMASPITGLVRGLNQLIAGLAQQLGQIAEQGLVGGADEGPQTSDVRPQDEGSDAEEAPAEAEEPPAEEETPPAEDAPAGDSGNAPTEEETSGDEPAETDETEAAPSEGDEEPPKED
jgi:large subunit ribosomal protein L10